MVMAESKLCSSVFAPPWNDRAFQEVVTKGVNTLSAAGMAIAKGKRTPEKVSWQESSTRLAPAPQDSAVRLLHASWAQPAPPRNEGATCTADASASPPAECHRWAGIQRDHADLDIKDPASLPGSDLHLGEGALVGLAVLQVYGLLDMHEHLEVVLPRVCSLLAAPGTESLLQVRGLFCTSILSSSLAGRLQVDVQPWQQSVLDRKLLSATSILIHVLCQFSMVECSLSACCPGALSNILFTDAKSVAEASWSWLTQSCPPAMPAGPAPAKCDHPGGGARNLWRV